MKSIRVLLSMLIVAAALTVTLSVKNAVAQHEGHGHGGSKTATVKGEIVDLSCYIGHGAKGAAHAQCAATCINKGLPMGILTKDNKLYLLTENHDNAAAYAAAKKFAAKQATVTGTLTTKDGIKAIAVASVK